MSALDTRPQCRDLDSNLEVNEAGNRFEAEVPLLTSGKQSIGALSVVFPYKSGDDKTALGLRAEKIRDELALRIPNSDALFARR
jgi:hypothetical protein